MTYPCCCPSRVYCDPDVYKYNMDYYRTRRGGSPVHYNQSVDQDCPGHPGGRTVINSQWVQVPPNSPIPDGHYCDCKEDMYSSLTDSWPSQGYRQSYEAWRLNGPIDIMLSNWESYAPRGGCDSEEIEGMPGVYRRYNCWSFVSRREWGVIGGGPGNGCQGNVRLRWNAIGVTAYPTISISWDLWCKNPGSWGAIGSLKANCEPYGVPGETAVRLGLPDGTEDPRMGGWLFKCVVSARNSAASNSPRLLRHYYDWWIDGDSATSHGDKVFGLPEGPIVPKLVYDEWNTPTPWSVYEPIPVEEWSHGLNPYIEPAFTWDVLLHIKPQVAVAAGLLSARAATEDIVNHYRPHLIGRTVGNVAVAAEVPA